MRRILALLLLAQSGFLFAQCTLFEIPLETRVDNSTLIVEGRVISSEAYMNEQNMINTIHDIEVMQIFKGQYDQEVLKIETKGGKLAYEIHVITPSLQLHEGETGIFLLRSTDQDQQIYKAYSGPQGFIAYSPNENTASDPFHTYEGISTALYGKIVEQTGQEPMVIRKYTIPSGQQNKTAGAITSISPTTITAGTKSVLTIKGTNFGAIRGTGSITFPNASSGPVSVSPSSSQYISWTDTEIKVEVPSGAGTGKVTVNKSGTFQSAETLLIEFAQLNVSTISGKDYLPDHIDKNGKGGYSFRMNTTMDANTNAKNSFLNAMQSWIDATCVNWEVIEPTPINTTIQDGTNILRFGNSGELSAGVLATTFSRWQSCSAGSIWYVGEIDLTYNPDVIWNYDSSTPKANEFDFESVTLHELGHAHQLGHVISEPDVMHRSIGPGSKKRELGYQNRVAGKFVMAQSVDANACGPGPMTLFPGCDPVGIYDEKTDDFFQLFPNPADNQVQLTWDGSLQHATIITFTDYSGKIVLKQPAGQQKAVINTELLPAGIYLVRVHDDGLLLYSSKLVLE